MRLDRPTHGPDDRASEIRTDHAARSATGTTIPGGRVKVERASAPDCSTADFPPRLLMSR